ncbi:amidohydrolase family protein [Janthinobacterium sp. SUN206]|uniref:amidohydrolase family protein n=1 Tax=Janthinobacterium sp. SUN206 TaxID=3014787 RepID=UPI00350F63C4
MRPGLSVDNEPSYSGDMFTEMRVALYIQRVMVYSQRLHGHHHAATPTNAFRLLEAATIDGAAVAGLEPRIGSLAPGKQVDLVDTYRRPQPVPCQQRYRYHGTRG